VTVVTSIAVLIINLSLFSKTFSVKVLNNNINVIGKSCFAYNLKQRVLLFAGQNMPINQLYSSNKRFDMD